MIINISGILKTLKMNLFYPCFCSAGTNIDLKNDACKALKSAIKCKGLRKGLRCENMLRNMFFNV